MTARKGPYPPNAARYMKAGQNSTAVEISSIRHLFPSGQPGHKPAPKLSRTELTGAVEALPPPATIVIRAGCDA